MIKNIELLRGENIIRFIPGREKPILNIPKVTIEKGESIFILGNNGAGKTTLMAFLAGHLPIEDAKLYWKKNLQIPAGQKLIPGIEGISFMPQATFSNSFLTVEEELEKHLRHLPDGQKKTLFKDITKKCQLKSLLTKKTGALSGGEKRRLGLSIALIKESELILLDEPFNDLDVESKQIFMEVLLQEKNIKGKSFVIVSHQQEEVNWLADKIWILDSGKIVETLNRENGEFVPKKGITAGLLGYTNIWKMKKYESENPGKTNSGGFIHYPAHLISTIGNNEKDQIPGKFKLHRTIKQNGQFHHFWRSETNHFLVSISGDPMDLNPEPSDLFISKESQVYLK